VEVRDFEWLSALEISAPVVALTDIEPGDSVVTFTRKELFRLKAEIEEQLGVGVAVIYLRDAATCHSQGAGAAVQRSNIRHHGAGCNGCYWDGMGLNLNIRRVIFRQLHKFDGAFRSWHHAVSWLNIRKCHYGRDLVQYTFDGAECDWPYV
jgi:hypothetical protein